MRAHLIIPAYNEEAVIGRCLRALAAEPGIDEVRVIVAVNGSTDDTARVARSVTDVPRLTVLEIPEASKTAALNAAGQEAARDRADVPWIYLDADIVLGPDALRPLVEALQADRPLVGTPAIRFEVGHSSPTVRRFYRVFTRLPYATEHLVGLGVYGVSAEGRRRFGQFPDLIADDLFVQQLFDPDERVRTAGTFRVLAPASLDDLLRVRTRVALGVTQLERRAGDAELPARATGSTTRATVRGLLRLFARHPGMALDIATYVLISLVARWRAAQAGVGVWHRDESTRRSTPTPGGTAGLPGVVEEVPPCHLPSPSSSPRTTKRS